MVLAIKLEHPAIEAVLRAHLFKANLDAST